MGFALSVMKQDGARITVLAENTVQARGLIGEHGLSLWIETIESCILFDSGQGLALPHNAKALGIKLPDAKAIVLSHGHYDHTGGLSFALGHAPNAKLFLHPSALVTRYSIRDGQTREIGIPMPEREAINARESSIIWSRKPTAVAPRMFVTGPIPRITNFEDTGGPFFLDANGNAADPIEDDQAMWINTLRGVMVILGCAHAGVINTLQYIKQLNPGRPIHTVVGGMHLVSANEARINRTVAALRAFGVQRCIPLHCTGIAATARLLKEYPNGLIHGAVGTHLDLL